MLICKILFSASCLVIKRACNLFLLILQTNICRQKKSLKRRTKRRVFMGTLLLIWIVTTEWWVKQSEARKRALPLPLPSISALPLSVSQSEGINVVTGRFARRWFFGIVIANFIYAILAHPLRLHLHLRLRLLLRHHHNHRNNHHDRREKLLILDIFEFGAKLEFEAILFVSLCSLLLQTQVRVFVVASVVVCKIEPKREFC